MSEVTSLAEVAPVADDEAGDAATGGIAEEKREEERGGGGGGGEATAATTAAASAAATAEKEEELVPWWILSLVFIVVQGFILFDDNGPDLVEGVILAVPLLGLTCYLAYRVSVVTRRGRGGEEEGARGEGVGGEALDERDNAQSKTQVAQDNTSHNDTFAWAMVAIVLFLTYVGAEAALGGHAHTFALPFTILPIPMAAMLAWAVTLPRSCSPWPVFVIVMLIMPYSSFIGYLMDPLSWGTSYQEYIKGSELARSYSTFGTMQFMFPLFLSQSSKLYVTTCLPFYLGLHATRDFLRREYTDPESAAGLPFRVGGEIAGALAPVVLYLWAQQYSGYIVEGAMRLQYAKHTPGYKKLPEGIYNEYGVPFAGHDLFSVIGSGSALRPSYVPRNATGTPALEYIWSAPSVANKTSTSRTGALPLSYDDTMRFAAVETYEKEGPSVSQAAVFQGYAIIYGMFSSQVFARVARVTFVDAVRFSVSWAEGVALASSFLLVLLATFTLGSGAAIFTQWFALFESISSWLVLFLLFSLWRIAVHAKTSAEMKKMKEKEEEEREKKDGTTEEQADEAAFTATAYLRRRRESTLTSSASSPSAAAATVPNTATGVQQDALDAAVAALQHDLELVRKEAAESKQRAASVELKNAELTKDLAAMLSRMEALEVAAAGAAAEERKKREAEEEGSPRSLQAYN